MPDTAETLKSKNLKVTPQRMAIYKMLLQTDAHPTAETVYQAISVDHPYISLATVYKTLGTLAKAGLVWEFNVGEGRFRYDGNVQPHHHMICTCCDVVYDLPLLNFLESVEKELESRIDFKVTATELYFYGICKACASTQFPQTFQ